MLADTTLEDTIHTSGINTFPVQTIELPVSELQGLFNELIVTYNALNEALKDQGILRGRELAELNTKANQAVKAEHSPIGKLFLLNTYIRRQISQIAKFGHSVQSSGQEVIRTAITKIQLRATAIVDHLKILAEGKKEISLNSAQARQFLAGREGKPPSRRDCIRALRRAEKICPTITCGHTPGDGRQTMRLIARTDDLYLRQRSRLTPSIGGQV